MKTHLFSHNESSVEALSFLSPILLMYAAEWGIECVAVAVSSAWHQMVLQADTFT